MGIGLIELGFGAYEFSRGDPIGGAVSVGAGMKDIKDSISDFKEARDLFERSREGQND